MTPGRRIRLLIVSQHLREGGLEEIVLTYARLLDRARYDITVACFIAGEAAARLEAMEGIRFVHIATTDRLQRLRQTIRLARECRADVVHNHACWYGVPAGRLAGAKTVETIHNMYHWFNGPERLGYGITCRAAHRVIAVSDAVRKFTARTMPLVRERDLTVVHNGIDLRRFDGPHDAAGVRARHGMRPGDVVVGFIGRLAEQKGVEFLLQASADIQTRHPSVKVLIVGDGERRDQLHRLSAELGLRNVIFAGHQRDVAAYLHALDVFVLPSLWEGLPVSVLEAMACSLPVVATRVSGTPEVVEEGITGRLVEPRDAAGLLSAITGLVADAGLRRRMGDAGRRRVEREFSAESMLASTEEVYRDLVRD